MIPISVIQEKIISALATFRFLTLSQMLILIEECNTYQTLWYHADRLNKKRRPFIDKISFNTITRIGRVEDMFYLTKYGATLLSQSTLNSNSEPYIPNNPQISSDYLHRKSTTDFHIHLSKSLNEDLQYFLPYYQKRRNKGKFISVTRILLPNQNVIIPDGVFRVSQKGIERDFLFEWHNGNDIRRIIDQTYNHASAMTSGSTHAAFDIKRSRYYYVLIVFETLKAKEKFLLEMSKHEHIYKEIAEFFLIKSQSEVHNRFEDGWTTLLGESASIKI